MPCDDCDNEMSAQQRAGLVVWLMARGHSFTTLEIAQITGLSRRGALDMMNRLCVQVPIKFEHSRWQLLAD
jgi:hypothetical protein